MSDSTKTPAQRSAEARTQLLYVTNRHVGQCEVEGKIDAYARACIDDAVAPTLEYLDVLLTKYMGTRAEELREIRKLLTRREGR